MVREWQAIATIDPGQTLTLKKCAQVCVPWVIKSCVTLLGKSHVHCQGQASIRCLAELQWRMHYAFWPWDALRCKQQPRRNWRESWDAIWCGHRWQWWQPSTALQECACVLVVAFITCSPWVTWEATQAKHTTCVLCVQVGNMSWANLCPLYIHVMEEMWMQHEVRPDIAPERGIHGEIERATWWVAFLHKQGPVGALEHASPAGVCD